MLYLYFHPDKYNHVIVLFCVIQSSGVINVSLDDLHLKHQITSRMTA